MTNSRLEKLHIYICIIAAFTATVVCIIMGETLYRMCVWISLSIIVFYVLGQITRLYIMSKVFPQAEAETPAIEGGVMDMDDMDDAGFMGDVGEIAEFGGEMQDETLPEENPDFEDANI